MNSLEQVKTECASPESAFSLGDTGPGPEASKQAQPSLASSGYTRGGVAHDQFPVAEKQFHDGWTTKRNGRDNDSARESKFT